jgi:hypothetical protein
MFALEPASKSRPTPFGVISSLASRPFPLPESVCSRFSVGTRSRGAYSAADTFRRIHLSIHPLRFCIGGIGSDGAPIVETSLIAGRRYQMQRLRAMRFRMPASPVECALTQKGRRGVGPHEGLPFAPFQGRRPMFGLQCHTDPPLTNEGRGTRKRETGV